MNNPLKAALPASIVIHLFFVGLLIFSSAHSQQITPQRNSYAAIQIELEPETKTGAVEPQNRLNQRPRQPESIKHPTSSNVDLKLRETAPGQAGIAAAGRSSEVDVSADPTRAATFTEELRQALDSHKEYPALARARKQSGRVGVGFTMMKTGQIINARVVSPCSYEKLNEAALQTVSKLGVFKPVPDSVSKVDWNVVVPIDFRLN